MSSGIDHEKLLIWEVFTQSLFKNKISKHSKTGPKRAVPFTI